MSFFPKFKLPNLGCGLSTRAAYTPVFTVYFKFQYFGRHGVPSSGCNTLRKLARNTVSSEILEKNISSYCEISLANFRLLFNLQREDLVLPFCHSGT